MKARPMSSRILRTLSKDSAATRPEVTPSTTSKPLINRQATLTETRNVVTVSELAFLYAQYHYS